MVAAVDFGTRIERISDQFQIGDRRLIRHPLDPESEIDGIHKGAV